MSGTDEDEERRHYMDVRFAFVEYSHYMKEELARIEDHYKRLPENAANKLSNDTSRRKLDGLRDAIKRNQAFLNAVVEHGDRCSPFPLPNAADEDMRQSRTTSRQVDKLNSTLHQLVRDWSAEGVQERAQSYGLVIDELEKRLPVDGCKRGSLRVLVPGAGLGRLVLDLVARGYATQGNEFSYFMLMVSNFVLNGVQKADAFAVSPFIDTQCNVFAVGDLLRTVKIPDVHPSSLLQTPGDPVDFSMTAGEWLDVYAGQTEEFDAIVTVFFLDTAPVVVEYIEAIARLLKKGGVWINFGPLLYHWAQGSVGETDERFQRSVELSWEEIRHVCSRCGLKIIHEEKHDAFYNANHESLMKTLYTAILSTAFKEPRKC